METWEHSRKKAFPKLLTSSEVELMETWGRPSTSFLQYRLLTSSEVELMETLHDTNDCCVRQILLTSSEVELMETVCSGPSLYP